MLTTDPHAKTMTDELFGPIVTCFVYEDDKFIETMQIADSSSEYALTGAMYYTYY